MAGTTATGGGSNIGPDRGGSAEGREPGVAPDRTVDDAVHHRVDDRTELGIDGLDQVSVIGTGGSATVYRARQPALDRIVAVKVVHAAWSMETRERFDREREVTGRLSGQAAIVPIFQTGITRRGEPYLLMPFYQRGSLFGLLRTRGPLPWREATFLIEGLARTVADCHADGVVHRDVKPGNVMLTRHAGPRLADFGITLPVGADTGAGAVAYTPSYSPPEAFRAGSVQPTVDVYALGATLWALLAGHPPHTEVGQPVEVEAVLHRASQGPPPPPTATTPGPLVELIDRAMAVAPADRPSDGTAFAAELRRAVRRSEDTETSATGRTGTAGRVRLGINRDRLVTAVLAGLIAAGVLLVLGGLGALVWS
ncbi:MAG: serine/threonine-protein kinase [Actinomycetota bacterium]